MTTRGRHLTIWQVVPLESTSLLALAEKYLNSLSVRDYSHRTVFGRRYYLGYFLAWCDERGLEKANEINREVVENYNRYLVHLKSKRCKGTLSDKSRYRHLQMLALWFDWLVAKNCVLYNPVRQVEFPKLPKKLPGDVLTASEAEMLINATDVSLPLGIRDRSILETLYSTGMRAAELIALTIYDLDIERGTIIVIKGKGNKDRLVPIGERAIKWLEKYLSDVRPKLVGPHQSALFLSMAGKSLASSSSLAVIVRRYKKAAKIEKKGAGHLFRRSMATLMLENGADIRYIQEILGHEYLSTTAVYTRVSIQHLKDIHEKTHPAECAKSRSVDTAPQTHPRQLVSRAREAECDKAHISLKMESSARDDLVARAEQYLQWMKSVHAALTIEDRCRHLKILLCWCHERAIIIPCQLTKDLVESYQSHLYRLRNKHNGRPLSSAYRLKLIGAVYRFCSWMLDHDYLLYNPVAHIARPKVHKRLPCNILSAQEVEKILSKPDVSKVLGVRDRAILETLYSTGIRRQECARLRVADVHFERATLLVVEGKGNKDRYVPIGKRALDWIDQYMQKVRPLLTHDSKDPTLFFTKYGLPFTAKGLGAIVRDYIKAANIGKTGACHIFRRTMATLMLENGADVRHIQEILGHSSLQSTQVYTKVNIKKLKEVHAKTHPAKISPTKTPEILDELNSQKPGI